MRDKLSFSFDTIKTREFGKSQAKLAEKQAALVAPTPFIFDYEEVEKAVLIFVGNDNPYVAKKAVYKGRDFIAVSKAFSNLTPILSRAAMLIAFYIINNIEFNSNIIKITEEDFKSFSGMGGTMFKEAMKELIRPELNHLCSGDTVKLLARTTRKSIYVVNHNFIFKGSIEAFGVILKSKYPEGCKLDSKGKVVIER